MPSLRQRTKAFKRDRLAHDAYLGFLHSLILHHFRFPTRRRVTINTFEYFFGCRVFWPLPEGLPHMVFARRSPRPWRPSPPPCGWSTGFIAVPRTVGGAPFHRFAPPFRSEEDTSLQLPCRVPP